MEGEGSRGIVPMVPGLVGSVHGGRSRALQYSAGGGGWPLWRAHAPGGVGLAELKGGTGMAGPRIPCDAPWRSILLPKHALPLQLPRDVPEDAAESA